VKNAAFYFQSGNHNLETTLRKLRGETAIVEKITLVERRGDVARASDTGRRDGEGRTRIY